MKRIVEIRAYNLKPGQREAFHQLVQMQSLPMLQRWSIDVIACGPSMHDDNSYFLVRGYASLEERQRSQDEFYGSAEWRDGPRAAIIALIENFTSAVVAIDAETIESLRRDIG